MVVTKEQFYEKLLAETKDVVSTCQFIEHGHYVSTFKYRYSGKLFGTIDTRYNPNKGHRKLNCGLTRQFG